MTIKELCLLLKTAESIEDIDKHRNDIATLIPEITVMFGYNQHNHAHQYCLWEHSLHTVLNLPRALSDDMLYLAALLHDIGKPRARCDGKTPEDKNWHYYGHPEISHEIVSGIVSRYELSTHDKHLFLYYVLHHDDHISLKRKHLRKHMQELSLAEFKHLMLLEVADAKAHILEPIVVQRIDVCTQWTGEYADMMLKENLAEDERIREKQMKKAN